MIDDSSFAMAMIDAKQSKTRRLEKKEIVKSQPKYRMAVDESRTFLSLMMPSDDCPI